MERYCKHEKLQTDQVSFFYKGSKLDQMHTPDELRMDNNDMIHITLLPVNVAAGPTTGNGRGNGEKPEEAVEGVGLGKVVGAGHRIAVERGSNTGSPVDGDDEAGEHGKSSQKTENKDEEVIQVVRSMQTNHNLPTQMGSFILHPSVMKKLTKEDAKHGKSPCMLLIGSNRSINVSINVTEHRNA
jgi:hypothetical protein